MPRRPNPTRTKAFKAAAARLKQKLPSAELVFSERALLWNGPLTKRDLAFSGWPMPAFRVGRVELVFFMVLGEGHTPDEAVDKAIARRT